MPQTLTTQRLALRPLDAADAVPIAQLVGDIDVSKWLTRVPYPYRLQDAENFIARTSQEAFNFGVVFGGAFAGVVSITEELGYWLGKPFWGRGIATEAATTVVDSYFVAGHDGVPSGHVIGNSPSRSVLQKLGFTNRDVREVLSASLGKTVQVQKMFLDRKTWQGKA